jgi:hypothetical protein
MKIEKEILDKTVKCTKDFDCLKNEKHIYCKVERVIDNKIDFIKCKEKTLCNYKLAIGYSNICTCSFNKFYWVVRCSGFIVIL